MTGVIFLESTELSADESDGAVQISVVRTGDLSGEVTVEFGITPDGATPGVDFDAPALGTVTFAAGEDRVTVPVAVLDDDLGEPSESFVVSLINVDSGFLQAPRTARVTILDDENPVTDPATPPLTSPYDVSELPVVTGLTQPIAFEFSPTNANRIYVAEKAGVIKAIDLDNNNAVTTVLDIRAEVNNRQDRGLLDIAIDPISRTSHSFTPRMSSIRRRAKGKVAMRGLMVAATALCTLCAMSWMKPERELFRAAKQFSPGVQART